MDISDKTYKDRIIKIGLNVAYYRKYKNITQQQLAEKSKLSRGLISHIEAPDIYKSFTFKTLFKIADALDIPPSKLIEFRDE